MIEVSEITKNYGPVRALDRVSFSVGEREILGFLGPNGAGKTTALRILTGFLPADSGSARVAGFDVGTQSLLARSALGYLPEGVPLYPEMRVTEYLVFRARLKGVSRTRRNAAVSRALEQAGIVEVEKRIVGTLSRGYRQRVGLADALLGDPKILILDEPTVGLDPVQVRQFRALLQDLGRERTVILSTHILGEVEQMAHKVAFIVRGRIAAQDTLESLRRRTDRIRLEIASNRGGSLSLSLPEAAGALRSVPGIEGVREDPGEGGAKALRFILRPRPGGDPAPDLFELARGRGWVLRELSRLPLSLEEIFIDVISKSPQEDGE